jgi:hypothetical protein
MFEDIQPQFFNLMSLPTKTPTPTRTPTATRKVSYEALKEVICVKLPNNFGIPPFNSNPNGVTFYLSRNGNAYTRNYCYVTPLTQGVYIEVLADTALLIYVTPFSVGGNGRSVIITTNSTSSGRDGTGRCRVDGIWAGNNLPPNRYITLGACSTVVGVTSTPTKTQTQTKTRVFATPTATPTATKNPSVSPTPTPTTTGTKTQTPTRTATATPTRTKTQTPTQTNRNTGSLCLTFPTQYPASLLKYYLGISLDNPPIRNLNFVKNSNLTSSSPVEWGIYTNKTYYSGILSFNRIHLINVGGDTWHLVRRLDSFGGPNKITTFARSSNGITGDYISVSQNYFYGKIFKQGSCSLTGASLFNPTPTPTQNFELDSASLVSNAANKSVILQNEDYVTYTQLFFTNGILTSYSTLTGDPYSFNDPNGTPQFTPTPTPTKTTTPTRTPAPTSTSTGTPTMTPTKTATGNPVV